MKKQGFLPLLFLVLAMVSLFRRSGFDFALYIVLMDMFLFTEVWNQVKSAKAESVIPPPQVTLYNKPEKDRSGYVYLLKTSVGSYKIGRTSNPEDRLATFKVKLPFYVEYDHLIKTDDRFKLERKLHLKYADKRIKGSEFFNLSSEEVLEIKEL